VRIRTGLAVALALTCALPAHAARDLVVRDSPRSAVATCLRATGAPGLVGLLAPLERRMSPYDLLRVSEQGAEVVGTARLGILDECPAVAAGAGGHAVVAGAARTRGFRSVVRATLAEPGGAFGAPVDLGRTRYGLTRVAVAVSPRGDAVVAWVAERGQARLRRFLSGFTRVLAAVRPAGGTFGAPQALTPWRRGGLGPRAAVSAGMDASGTATVAWSQPLPNRRNLPIPLLSTVAAAAAPPGDPFGAAQVVARRVPFVRGVALAVAADGRALLAHDGEEAIEVYERRPGESRFGPPRRLRPRHGTRDWQKPAVAVAADGSALVAWRGDQLEQADVLLTSRRGTGAWTAVHALHRNREDDLGVSQAYAVVTSIGLRPTPPLDEEGTDLHVAMGPDGRYLVGWGMERRLPLGDRPVAARMAQGQAGVRAGSHEAAGCTCRAVNGVVPLVLPGGDLTLAYTDNVGRWDGFAGEFPRRSGRLHLAELGPSGPGPAPPRVTVRRPRLTTLDYGDKLRVRARCNAACDLRAYVIGKGGRARGLGSASLRAAGSARLSILPDFDRHLAPPGGGRARVVVHGYAPNGRRFARRSVPVELRRTPLRPLPEVLDVRAVRRGSSVVVTWETNRAARRVAFEVRGRPSGPDLFPIADAYVPGRGQRRFRAELRSDEDLRTVGRIETVAVVVYRTRPPYDRRTVVVPVVG
jgi:hypothetical protein